MYWKETVHTPQIVRQSFFRDLGDIDEFLELHKNLQIEILYSGDRFLEKNEVKWKYGYE